MFSCQKNYLIGLKLKLKNYKNHSKNYIWSEKILYSFIRLIDSKNEKIKKFIYKYKFKLFKTWIMRYFSTILMV